MDDRSSVASDDVFFTEEEHKVLDFTIGEKKKIRSTTMSQPKESQPKMACITIKRDQRRSSIFEAAPIKLNLFTRGSSIMSFAHNPSTLMEEEEEKLQYENTYRTEPHAKFPVDDVKEIIYEVLSRNLKGQSYSRPSSIVSVKQLAQQIKNKIKDLNLQRYKIIASVSIGEKKEQDFRMGSRCVWDLERDSYSSAYYENTEIFAVGTVFALYYE